MTSYRRIISRTLNRDVRQQDNMVKFMSPLSQAIYPNYFSVPDASNTCLLVSNGSEYSANANAKLTFNGTKLDVSANMHVGGNLDVSGTILAAQFLPGQVINVAMLNYSDLSQTPITVGPGDASSNIFSYSYTPKNATSYILMEYQTIYNVGGNGPDFAEAFLFVNDASNNLISQTFQQWTGVNPGTGTRSGTVFPIVGRYTNTNVTSKTISVSLNTATDAIVVSADNSTWLKITEIGR
jgi:hypothetical protein